MNFLTKWAFRNKASVTLLVIISLIAGAVSYYRLPMEFLPEAANPQVSVITIGQGYDAGSLAKKVTDPIERAVTSVKGKKSVLSTTGDGYSQVQINFDSKTNMKEAKREVEDLLSGVSLPKNVAKPQVSQLNTSMIPIAQVSLTFDEGITKETTEQAQKKLLPLFENKKSIAQASIFGENTPQIEVKLDQKKIQEKKLPLNTMMTALQGQNVSTSAGEVTLNQKKSAILVTDNVKSLDTLRKLPIPQASPQAPSVTLGDVASIKLKNGSNNLMRINGNESLAIMIMKESAASAVTTSKDVKDTIAAINKDNPGVKAKLLFSTGEMVEDSVNSMMREVLIGALFATLIILVFLRRFKPTLVTIVSIPLSLGITLLLLWLSGITLNILTLGGVAVAVGRLVDDSIVVVENIFRKSQKQAFSKEVVMKATTEVARAITSSTLITVAVFLPMGLVNGSLREFLLPFGLTVTYSLLASLLVALTVVPLLSNGMLKKMKLPAHREPKRYVGLLRWSLNHKYVPILLAVVVLVGSIGLYVALPKGATDSESAGMASIKMEFPSNTPVADLKKQLTSFEKKLTALSGTKYIISQYGVSESGAKYGAVGEPNVVDFTVIMNDNKGANAFIDEVNKLKKEEQNVEITASAASMSGGAGGAVITYDVMGSNVDEVVTTSKDIMSRVEKIDGVKKVSSNQEKTVPLYTVQVKSEKANAEAAAQQVASLISPMPIGAITLDEQTVPVVLNADLTPTKANQLKKLPVLTPKGVTTLGNIATITASEQPSTVLTKDGKPYVRVSMDVEPEQLSEVAAKVDSNIKKVKLPKGVSYEQGGAAQQQGSDFVDLGLTMLASIVIVFLIMVMTFKTIRAPLAILMTLPLASIGAVLGLLLSGVSADPTALIGGLMLIGIVITNAIVLIDRVKQNEEHMIMRDAILEACATRLRPVIMTAVATVFAMIPLLFTEAEGGSLVSKSLAVVVIGGLSVATVLTLVIVPVFYELLHFRKSKRQRQKAAQKNDLSL
ncbi:AcrB/AcrD/AcrF family transporter [Fictibacillus macauensis ZFHKF-1]|uniref:AcrB/AcrD/AcrF family transporter n=1 Tax=Fictibacillus macauensis ZFHKF-1 TaxID=1196324 RepID=I8IXJ9_9BACL|nr:efflux RND transporter permease subunit [Fictibacillus macauensis]EIT84216.1 AcrB/AcrD/AcrF family transporter [Fictibacillus macauensis ZFHKF-1]